MNTEEKRRQLLDAVAPSCAQKNCGTSTGRSTSRIQEYRSSNGKTMYRVNNAVGCSSRTLAEAFVVLKMF